MFTSRFETGYLHEKFAFVRFGSGPEKLVIFPPLDDALYEIKDVAWYLVWYFRGLASRMTIEIIGRPKGIPLASSTRDLAHLYAEALLEAGPVNLMGISLGGMIAQHFAALYPEKVRRLILVAASHKMGGEGLEIARKWIPWAKERKWTRIYLDTLDLTYTGWRRQLYTLLTPFVERLFLSKIRYPEDFIISGQAAMIHDASSVLDRIMAKTLIIGGPHDPFYPVGTFYEMAELISNSTLFMVPGAGHGVYEEGKKRCEAAILSWITSSAALPAPAP